MQEEISELQFCNIQFKDLLEKATQCKIKIVGIIKSVFSAKKYIVEVYINEQVLIRTIRKYNQFEATYEVIKMKFRNFDLGAFPSKYQVFGKDETRKQYFEWLMNKIIENFVHNPENDASKRLFSILYLFMTRSLVHKQKYLKQSNQESESLKSFEKKRKLSLTQMKGEFSELQIRHERRNLQFSDRKEQNLTEFEIERHRVRRNSQGSFVEYCIAEQMPEAKTPNSLSRAPRQATDEKTKQFMKLSQNLGKKQNKDCYFEIRFENQTEWRKRYLKIENSSLLIYKDKMENHFRTKIELYRIVAQNYHRQKNLFDDFCQKMEINNEPEFPQDPTIIAVYHEYDFQKLLIRGIPYQMQGNNEVDLVQVKEYNIKEQNKIQKFGYLLRRASQISPIHQKFEGVFNPIGKIFILIHKLTIGNIDSNLKDILRIKIRTLNLEYECKKLLLKEQNIIRQGFLIPISSAFQTISIDAIVSREQGWIRQEYKDFNIGFYPIEFSQILTKPSGYKFQKINVALMKSSESNAFLNSQTRIQYSLENYSHFSSIYAQSFASQNDGKIITGLKLEDMDELSVTVDRVLRIIGHAALLIINFWRNVYQFKYPKLAKTFFSILLLLCLFAEIKVFFTIAFFILIFVILYNHPKLHRPLNILIQSILFSQIHPNFVQPLCLGTTEIKYRKWCDAFAQISREYQLSKENRLEKKQNVEKPSILEYKFKVYQKTFTVTQEVKGFFGKVFEGKKVIEVVSRIISGIVNTVQKFCNLFLWIDTNRSGVFLILLIIFSGVANDFLVRIIGSIFCVHRLVKGMNFYKLKHYPRNRKVGIFTLRYIIKKNFPNLVQAQQNLTESQAQNEIIKRKLILRESKVVQELDEAICSVQFPLSDENNFKKLKNELLKLIGVYLDIDQLREQKAEAINLKESDRSGKSSQNKKDEQKTSATTQNSNTKMVSVSLATVLKIIQTCETRLSLDWVPGREGLTNEFQELKKQTKQVPVIDVWIEHMLSNFILNIPSQMFIKLKSQTQRPQQKVC